MVNHNSFLFEALINPQSADAMDDRWQPGGGLRRKEAAKGGIERGGIEPIRRRAHPPDDEPLTHPKIPVRRRGRENDYPDCTVDNRVFRTEGEALQAARAEAQRLNNAALAQGGVGTYTIEGPEGPHQEGQSRHFHIRAPDGRRCPGHFFFGPLPYPTDTRQRATAPRRNTADDTADMSRIAAERDKLQARQQRGELLTRQERGRLKWLRNKYRSLMRTRVDAQLQTAGAHKRSFQREHEYLFEAPLATAPVVLEDWFFEFEQDAMASSAARQRKKAKKEALQAARVEAQQRGAALVNQYMGELDPSGDRSGQTLRGQAKKELAQS